ncbi:trans-aconitate 2-methyltransferase [Mycobacterium sp.]|uniref:class I SAM-dependent methyltransferase n=1 Tax=Mycobacterium sp. TaxID=1785 RepID=UPI00127F6E1C|nr:class I SAM-dependent methyltransferase [Mycobacterium sp.]KAA8965446.1 MAG: class I SAM-dependent methyltransferase [Mycobacterium sp.]
MTSTIHTDPYAVSAEFYEVMAIPHWAAKRDVLVAALTGAGAVTEPVLDVGAGTGLSTVAIADTIPAVAIHAVEPSAAMRAALVSRILGREDLADRVTVHPAGIEDVDLPDRIGAAVLMGVIGFLDRDARERLWTQLRHRITPRAPVVVEVMAIDRPMPVPEMTIAEQRIGRRHNEVRISGQPAGDGVQRWKMRYQVRENDQIVRDVTAEYVWHTVGFAELAEEAEKHAMTLRQLHPLIGVLHARNSHQTTSDH